MKLAPFVVVVLLFVGSLPGQQGEKLTRERAREMVQELVERSAGRAVRANRRVGPRSSSRGPDTADLVALGRIGAEEVGAALEGEWAQRQQSPNIKNVGHTLSKALLEIGEPAGPTLAAIARHEDVEFRRWITEGLARQGLRSHVVPKGIFDFLNDPDPEGSVRMNALALLGNHPGLRSHRLVNLVGDPLAEVSLRALQMLTSRVFAMTSEEHERLVAALTPLIDRMGANPDPELTRSLGEFVGRGALLPSPAGRRLHLKLLTKVPLSQNLYGGNVPFGTDLAGLARPLLDVAARLGPVQATSRGFGTPNQISLAFLIQHSLPFWGADSVEALEKLATLGYLRGYPSDPEGSIATLLADRPAEQIVALLPQLPRCDTLVESIVEADVLPEGTLDALLGYLLQHGDSLAPYTGLARIDGAKALGQILVGVRRGKLAAAEAIVQRFDHHDTPELRVAVRQLLAEPINDGHGWRATCFRELIRRGDKPVLELFPTIFSRSKDSSAEELLLTLAHWPIDKGYTDAELEAAVRRVLRSSPKAMGAVLSCILPSHGNQALLPQRIDGSQLAPFGVVRSLPKPFLRLVADHVGGRLGEVDSKSVTIVQALLSAGRSEPFEGYDELAIAALASENVWVQASAVISFMEGVPERHADALAACADHPTTFVALYSAVGLRKVRPQVAARALTEVMGRDDANSSAVLGIYYDLRDVLSRDLLQRAARSESTNMRIQACVVAERLLEVGSVPWLLEAMKDPSQKVRDAARRAIDAIRFAADTQRWLGK